MCVCVCVCSLRVTVTSSGCAEDSLITCLYLAKVARPGNKASETGIVFIGITSSNHSYVMLVEYVTDMSRRTI